MEGGERGGGGCTGEQVQCLGGDGGEGEAEAAEGGQASSLTHVSDGGRGELRTVDNIQLLQPWTEPHCESERGREEGSGCIHSHSACCSSQYSPS